MSFDSYHLSMGKKRRNKVIHFEIKTPTPFVKEIFHLITCSLDTLEFSCQLFMHSCRCKNEIIPTFKEQVYTCSPLSLMKVQVHDNFNFMFQGWGEISKMQGHTQLPFHLSPLILGMSSPWGFILDIRSFSLLRSKLNIPPLVQEGCSWI